MPLDRSWRAAQVYWKRWSDGAVVFNVLSGNTHLLNPTAAMVLEALEQQPANAVDLARRLAAQIQIDPDEELTAHVETLLSNLDVLGLIEPVL